MAFLDLLTYLPDDILAKVDRASMSASLEVRVPLLDDAVVRFAALLPDGYKVRGQTGKWLLRRVAYRYIPRRLLDRPKAGFAMPLNAWLRGPLRPWVEDLLRSDPGLLHHQAALELWQNCLQGRAQTQQELWAILMLYAWHRDRASAIQSQPARAINAGQPT